MLFYFPPLKNDLFFALQQHLLEKSEKCYLYGSDSLREDSFDYHPPKKSMPKLTPSLQNKIIPVYFSSNLFSRRPLAHDGRG